LRELATLYASFTSGTPSPLPELAIQYTDYVLWQRERLQGKALATLVEYWKGQLAELPILTLPTDRPRLSTRNFHAAALPVIVHKQLTEALKALSRQEGVTLFMTLL